MIFGICGGYQMLGRTIRDPDGVEAAPAGEVPGMGLLDMDTVFQGEKLQRQTQGRFGPVPGALHALTGLGYHGYEIHMGRGTGPQPALQCRGNVYGSYIHGIFDGPGIADAVVRGLAEKKGVDLGQLPSFDPERHKQQRYDLLADTLRAGLDMDFVYKVLNREV